jgi:hypothetical protein
MLPPKQRTGGRLVAWRELVPSALTRPRGTVMGFRHGRELVLAPSVCKVSANILVVTPPQSTLAKQRVWIIIPDFSRHFSFSLASHSGELPRYMIVQVAALRTVHSTSSLPIPL